MEISPFSVVRRASLLWSLIFLPVSSGTRRISRSILLATLCIVLMLLAHSIAPVVSARQRSTPAGQILNPNGTLTLGAGRSGTVDLRGWNVTLDSRRGPILTRQEDQVAGSRAGSRPHSTSLRSDSAAPLAPAWQAMPGNGLNSLVETMAFSGSELYVGGHSPKPQTAAS